MNYKIKEMQEELKPRYRAKNKGISNLSNEELISIILKCGTKEKSVKEISSQLLKENDIHELKNVTLEKIMKIKGIGKVKAATLLATIELGNRINRKVDTINDIKVTNSKIIYEYFKNVIGEKSQEYFYCVYLDNSKKVIKNKLLFMGTLNYSTVHPREIFKEAYLANATSIICIHNHPTGNVTPSKNDIELTNNLIKVGNLLGISITDHIIIGKNNYYSFFENNLI